MRKEVIGGATLYLGDCLEVMEEIAGAEHVITDPPFEARMHMLHAQFKLRRTDGGPQRKELDFDSVQDTRGPFLDQVKRINKGWLIAFCNVEGVGEWQAAILARQMKFKTTCVWIKPDATPKLNGQGPALSYECFTTTWCGSGYAKWNAGGKRGVYTHPTNNPDRHGEHPSEKSLALMKEILADFTNEGETILDPFMGSGTTGCAAVMGRREFIGIEQSERYFDIACERIAAAQLAPTMFIETISNKASKAAFIPEDEMDL